MTNALQIPKATDMLAKDNTDNIKAMTHKIMKLTSGGRTLNAEQAVELAVYCYMTDLNPFNGEAAAFFEARSRLWKRAAKKYRGLCLEFCEYVDAQATADRRRELLRKLEHELCDIEHAMCPICGNYGHGPDCELVEHLGKGIIQDDS